MFEGYKTKAALPILLIAVSSVMTACTKNDGSGSSTGTTASLSIQGVRPDGTTGSSRTANYARAELATASTATIDIVIPAADGTTLGTLTLSDARIAIEKIKFKSTHEVESEDDETVSRTDEDESSDISTETEEEDDDSATDSASHEAKESDYEGPYVVNLITNEVTPSLADVVLPAELFTQVKIELHKIEGGEDDGNGGTLVAADDPLYDNSIYLAGTYTGQTSGGAVVDMPFYMSYDLSEEFRLSAPSTADGIDLSQALTNSVIIAFNMQEWFAFDQSTKNPDGLDFTSFSSMDNGFGTQVLNLNKDSESDNHNLREVIKDLIKKSGHFGKDEDGNGELAEAEDASDDNSGE